MAQEMIKKIKQAEDASSMALSAADEKAKEILNEATKQINDMNKKLHDLCETQRRQKIYEANQEAEKIKESYEKKAAEEVQKVRQNAEINRETAVSQAMKILLV